MIACFAASLTVHPWHSTSLGMVTRCDCAVGSPRIHPASLAVSSSPGEVSEWENFSFSSSSWSLNPPGDIQGLEGKKKSVVLVLVSFPPRTPGLTLVRVGEVPGDVERPSGLQGGLGLAPGHPAGRRRPERVQEVQGEVAALGEVEADVCRRRRAGEQDQEQRRPPHLRC